MRAISRRWEIPFSFVFLDLPLLAGNGLLGPVHMISGHMNFSLPRGNFEKRVTRCTTPGNRPFQGNFSPCGQNAKVASGQE